MRASSTDASFSSGFGMRSSSLSASRGMEKKRYPSAAWRARSASGLWERGWLLRYNMVSVPTCGFAAVAKSDGHRLSQNRASGVSNVADSQILADAPPYGVPLSAWLLANCS